VAQLRRYAAALFAGFALLVTGSGSAAAITPPVAPPNAALPPLPLPSPTPTPLPTVAPSLPAVADTGSGASLLPSTGTGASAPTEQPQQQQQQQEQQYEQQQAEVRAQMPALYEQYGAVALQLSANDGPFTWPELTTNMSQGFGCTTFMLEPANPDCPTRHWHTGLDIVGPAGTPVFAAASGVARVFPGSVGYGNYVIVIHSDQYATLYGHLTAFTLHDGDEVKKGDVIGLEGSTGFSTGPHLHFEIRQNGDYVDPLPFFTARAVAPPQDYAPTLKNRFLETF
jgi:murein DD-endopeptidase MepM/ murein hydrolase activator NlpD